MKTLKFNEDELTFLLLFMKMNLKRPDLISTTEANFEQIKKRSRYRVKLSLLKQERNEAGSQRSSLKY